MFKKANNQMIVSLRSKNGEALPVALKLQGGGHANASGAVLAALSAECGRSLWII